MNDLLTQTELLNIFQYLHAQQILEIATVCQFWATLIQDEGLWKCKCISDRQMNFTAPSMTWRKLYFQKPGFFKSMCHHLSDIEDLLTMGMSLFKYTTGKKADEIFCSTKGCSHTFTTLWMCMAPDCGQVGCGRRDGKHSLQHHQSSEHPLFIKLNTFEMWCHICEKWVGKKSQTNEIEVHQVSTIYNYLISMLPPDHVVITAKKLNERRIVERLLQEEDSNDGMKYVIPGQWQRDWERFLIGDNDPPGVIDLDPFFQSNGNFVSPFPRFGVVEPPVWEYFKTVYQIKGCIVFWYKGKKLQRVQLMGPDGQLVDYEER